LAELKPQANPNPWKDRAGRNILFAREPDLSSAEFIAVLGRSGLDGRRPVADHQRIETMLRNADLIVTARADSRLIGVARSVTDFAYCCYLSDLAVDRDWQGRGIGRELMLRTRAEAGGRQVRCILLSAPAAVEFYTKVGLKRHEHCFDFTELED
jgi:GNAT superfamily N-acetyltransferase